MNNKPINKKLFALILGIIFLVFFSIIAINEFALVSGEEVFLKTRPVDPRDLLRGDYVILSYQVESNEIVKDFVESNELSKGDIIYIVLKKDKNNLGDVVKVLLNKPKNNILFIRARVADDRRASADIGVGKYFVPEGRGREVERFRGDLEVLVSIISSGEAKIKGIYHEGELIDFKEKKSQ